MRLLATSLAVALALGLAAAAGHFSSGSAQAQNGPVYPVGGVQYPQQQQGNPYQQQQSPTPYYPPAPPQQQGPTPTYPQAQQATYQPTNDGYTEAQRARVTPVVEVVRRNRDAVVNIAATQIIEVRGGGFLDLFDTPYSRKMKTNSVGSGAVIHPSGYVLTNAHVIAQASELKVIFADKSELPAEVVASMPEVDLAIVRVRPQRPLKAIKLGRSSDLMVGESVIAIGNPVGLQHSVTTGIVSALGRDMEESPDVTFHDVIQTDAAINPGNSGGPLLNALGEQIGVTTAIRTDAQNVGFAIPVDRVKQLLPQLLGVESHGRVKLGIRWGGELENGRGVSIAKVEPGSPAQRARLGAGQVVTNVAGQPAMSLVDALVATLEQPVGRPFPMTVLDGGQYRDVRLTIEELPKPDAGQLVWQRFGLRLAVLDADEAQRRGLRGAGWLVVTGVQPGSDAAKAGIAQQDLIAQVDRYGVQDMGTLGLLLEQVQPGDDVSFDVVRLRGRMMYRSAVVLRAR